MIIIRDKKIQWPGKSGVKYDFSIHAINDSFSKEGAVYIFTKPQSRAYLPVYIGKTDNMKERFSNHEKWDDIIKLGATKVHIHIDNVEKSRIQKETDLIERWKPELNVQHT